MHIRSDVDPNSVIELLAADLTKARAGEYVPGMQSTLRKPIIAVMREPSSSWLVCSVLFRSLGNYMAHHLCRLLHSNPLAPFGSLFEIEIEKDHSGETKEAVMEDGDAEYKIITLLKLMRYDLLVGKESLRGSVISIKGVAIYYVIM